MRKVILFIMTTLDGFYAGPDGDLDWHNVDDEFNDFAATQLDSADTLLFGRKTFDIMASYWPTSAAATDDPNIASKMNAIHKVVFSKTLESVTWHNTRLVKERTADVVTELKQQPGQDMLIFGSSIFATSLAQLGLIDEFRLMISPVVLGQGLRLFAGIDTQLRCKLLRTQPFASGNVLLYYHPATP